MEPKKRHIRGLGLDSAQGGGRGHDEAPTCCRTSSLCQRHQAPVRRTISVPIKRHQLDLVNCGWFCRKDRNNPRKAQEHAGNQTGAHVELH